MEDLEAARRRYNELYPDRPIKRIGDTVESYYHLVIMSGAWLNATPLSDQEIAAVEAMTPPGVFLLSLPHLLVFPHAAIFRDW